MNDGQNTTDPTQPKDDMFNPSTDEEKLSQDGQTPAAPADDVPGAQMPSTQPQGDSGVDADQQYQEGTSQAAGYGTQSEGPDTSAKPADLQPEDPTQLPKPEGDSQDPNGTTPQA